MQLEFEDGISLLGGEGLFGIDPRSAAAGVDVDLLAAEISDQVLAGVGTVRAAANDGDDVVKVIQRLEVTFEDVLAVSRLVQQVGGTAADYIHAMLDEVLDGLDDAHFTGLSVDHRQQDHLRSFPASACV